MVIFSSWVGSFTFAHIKNLFFAFPMLPKRFQHTDFPEYGTVVLPLSVCLCLFLVGCKENEEAPAVRGTLVIDGTKSYDFGPQPQKIELAYPFTLVNQADVPVLFTGIKSSCGCTWAADNDDIVGSVLPPQASLDFPVFLSTGTSQDEAASVCKKPNPNQKGCSNPTDEISDCDFHTLNAEACTGKAMYSTPEQIPDGSVDSATGTVATTRIDCIKRYGCEYNSQTTTCGPKAGHIKWENVPAERAEKIIVGINPCPDE